MKNILRLKIISFLILLCVSCAQKPDLTNEPTIEYLGASKKILKQSSLLQDTTFLSFKIADGDGDIGDLDNKRKTGIQVIDKRTGNIYDDYVIPAIPQQGANNGVVINMRLLLFSTCCVLQPCDPFKDQPNEKLPLEVTIMDNSGNKSKPILINDLELRCY